jgi:hypothetical protein
MNLGGSGWLPGENFLTAHLPLGGKCQEGMPSTQRRLKEKLSALSVLAVVKKSAFKKEYSG